MNIELFEAPLELKFVNGGEPGEIEGYGAVFGNQDSHDDVIVPGAFQASLDRHKAEGTLPAMHVLHDWAAGMGGETSLPAGVWNEMSEDNVGLRVKGKISALDTDYGRRVRGLAQDGALKGLSIAFTTPPGGAERPKSKDGPKRLLKNIDLHAVDLVTFPSNKVARLDSVKSVLASANHDDAAKALQAAIGLHLTTMSGGDSATAEERAQMLKHLQDAHEALTGRRMPKGLKARPQTIREFEASLREMGYSNADAHALAERGFKSLTSRDETEGKAKNAVTDEVMKTFVDGLNGLNLTL